MSMIVTKIFSDDTKVIFKLTQDGDNITIKGRIINPKMFFFVNKLVSRDVFDKTMQEELEELIKHIETKFQASHQDVFLNPHVIDGKIKITNFESLEDICKSFDYNCNPIKSSELNIKYVDRAYVTLSVSSIICTHYDDKYTITPYFKVTKMETYEGPDNYHLTNKIIEGDEITKCERWLVETNTQGVYQSYDDLDKVGKMVSDMHTIFSVSCGDVIREQIISWSGKLPIGWTYLKEELCIEF